MSELTDEQMLVEKLVGLMWRPDQGDDDGHREDLRKEVRAILAAASPVRPEPVATEQTMHWRHVKTGGLYEIIAHADLEANEQTMVIYQSKASGKNWARPASEFYDGRFIREGATPTGDTSEKGPTT